MNWRLRFRIPRYWVGLYFKLAFKKREGVVVRGVTNKVGHRYVLFLDYDYDEKHSIYAEIESLQETYNLGNAYIFKTLKGYHIIFLDLMSYQEFKNILSNTSCDEHYKSVPMMNNARAWVLRITDKQDNKIIFDDVMYSPQTRPTSEPHSRLLIMRGVPDNIINKNIEYEEATNKQLIFAEYEA